MRFDNYIIKIDDRADSPQFQLNGEYIDFNTFRTIYKEINDVLTHGINDVKSSDTRVTIEPWYKAWKSMLSRCDTANRESNYGKSYENVHVGYSWVKASNFKNWYNYNIYKILSDSIEDRLEIDKDIRIPGNTTYSEEACLIVTARINRFFVNSYKFGAEYELSSRGQYITSVGIFNTDERIHVLSNDPYELRLLYAKEKNKQLRERVIPYFKSIIHPDYRNSPMVKLVLKTLKSYDFVKLVKRNKRLIDTVVNEVDAMIPEEEKTAETLANLGDTIADCAFKHFKQEGMIKELSFKEIESFLDIVTEILSRNIEGLFPI